MIIIHSMNSPTILPRILAPRLKWFAGYAATYLERDVLQLAAIQALVEFRRLMRAACLRLGNLVNQTELGRDVGLPQPTVHRYLAMLETSYQLIRLPAYAVTRGIMAFREEYGQAVKGGLVLHSGAEIYWLSEGVLAAPWWRVI